MSRIQDRLKELQDEMQNIVSETKSRQESLNIMINDMDQAVVKVGEEEQKLNQESVKLENEIKLLETDIGGTKSKLKACNETLAKLEPEIEELNKQLNDLKENINSADSKSKELTKNNEINENKLKAIIKDLDEKEEAKKGLESSIDEKVAVNQEKLEEKKKESEGIIDEYLIWDYLMARIDQPEVEIMAIIASNRLISLDEIKKKAKSVSPVFIGRAISKLEADEKIVQDGKGNWDIAPSLLEVFD